MHTRENDILFLNALKISLAPTLQEGPCHVMFVGILHTEDHKGLNTCEFKSQDTTKITCAIVDPGTMKLKTRYQEPTREGDDSQLPSSSRASDALSGTGRTSYQVREPIQDDEERLAMKQGDMLPPVPERVASPRIRDDRAVQEFQSNSDKMHRATSDDAFTQAWFNYCRNVLSQSVRKTGTNGDICSVNASVQHPLQQRGFLQPEERIPEGREHEQASYQSEKFNVTELSLLREFW